MADAFPPAEEWQKEFPDCYTETPDGQYDVAYRNPGNTAFENERNSARAQALISDWRTRCAETSDRRNAEVPTVRVRDASGVVMDVPARLEQKLAAKGQVVPVKFYGRGTRYWTDSHGRRWKRRHRGEWERDE